MSDIAWFIRSASSARCHRLRVVGEELAVLVHELAELLLGVLAPVVRVDEPGEVGDHVLDRREVLLGRVLQRLLHRGERAVEHLPAQQVLDLLVGLPRLARSPVVVLERADGARGVVGQGVQLRLGQPGGVVGIGEQLPPLRGQCPVEQLADLLQRAVHPPGLAGLAQPVAHRPAQLVEPTPALGPAAQQLPQRLPHAAAAEHAVADLVDGVAQVVGRGQRVGPPAPAAVPVAPVPPRPRHLRPRTRCGRRRCPWPAGG
jgi:hypothetical protein